MATADVQIAVLPTGPLEISHFNLPTVRSLCISGSHGYLSLHLTLPQAEQLAAALGVYCQELRENPAGLQLDDEIDLAPPLGGESYVGIQQ